MSSVSFLRDIRKRKLALDRMSSEGMVLLANQNLLLNSHPPLLPGIEVERNYCWDSVCFQRDELLVKHNCRSESVSDWSAAD